MRQALQSDRARVVLEELDRYKERKEKQILAGLARAKAPDEAFALACEYRALSEIMAGARADIAVGDAAMKNLLEEE